MGRHHGKFDRPPFIGSTGLVGIESGFYGSPTPSNDVSPATIQVINIGNDWIGERTQGEDIWKVVRNQWKTFTSDVEQALLLIHDSYLGWFLSDSTPDDKAMLGQWIADSIANRKTELVRISPVGSQVIGEVATVHYHYLWIYFLADGNRIKEIGQYTETYLKVTGTWQLINDHGGPTG